MNATTERLAPAVPFLTTQQKALLKRTLCKPLTDDQFELFVTQVERTRLDPFTRQIYWVRRYDKVSKEYVMTVQTSIDGLRVIADRTGKYAGQLGPEWCDSDGKWRDLWLEDVPPVAARVGILRSGWEHPLWSVARYSAYAQTDRDGKVTRMWSNMADLMIAKAAEALGLRKAFPQELSGLYTSEEMDQADNVPEPAENDPQEAQNNGAYPHTDPGELMDPEQINTLYGHARDLHVSKETLDAELERRGIEQLTRDDGRRLWKWLDANPQAILPEGQQSADESPEPEPPPGPAPDFDDVFDGSALDHDVEEQPAPVGH